MANLRWEDTEPVAEAPRWEETEPVAEGPSSATSAFRGFTDDASFGLMDEFGGLVEAVGSKVGLRGLTGRGLQDVRRETPEEDKQGFWDVYEQGKRAAKGIQDEAREANPTAYMGGQLAGAVSTGFVPGLNVAKGASATSALAKMGAGGALYGFGKSEADNLKDLAVDTGTGGVAGAGFGYLGGKLADKLGDASGAISTWLGDKFKGAGRGMAKAAITANYKPARKMLSHNLNPSKIDEITQYALDSGIIKPFRSAGGIADAAGAVADDLGPAVGNIRQQLDDAGAKFDWRKVGDKVDELADEWDMPGNDKERIVAWLRDKAETYRGKGETPFSDAGALRKQLGYNEKKVGIADPDIAAFRNKISTVIGKGEDEAVDAFARGVSEAGEQFGDVLSTGTGRNIAQFPEGSAVVKEAVPDRSELVRQWLDARRGYHLGGKIKDAASYAAETQSARKFPISAYDVLVGGGGGYALSGGDPQAALAAGVAMRAYTSRGRSTMAFGLDKIGNLLKAAPQRLGPYARQLSEAFQRSPNAGAAAHYLLFRRDPDYRERVKSVVEDGEAPYQEQEQSDYFD